MILLEVNLLWEDLLIKTFNNNIKLCIKINLINGLEV